MFAVHRTREAGLQTALGYAPARQGCRLSHLAWRLAGAWLCALALLVLSAGAAHAATIVVNSTADTVAVNSLCTLREAIANANNDAATYPDCTAGSGADTITFNVNGTITLGSALPNITSTLTISGNGTANTIIQAKANPNTASYRIISATSANGNLTLRGVTLRHGGSAATSVDGGCVRVDTSGQLTLADSIVESCYGRFGGGVSAISAGLTVTNTLVQNNFATRDGGGIDAQSSAVTITNSTVTNNRNINPSNNGAGGGITNVDNSSFTMTGSVVSNNTLTSTLGGNGGGLYVVGFSGGATVIISSVITGNSASPNNAGTNGGGIYYGGSDPLTLVNTVVRNNAASARGGGIYDLATGTLTLANVTVSGNAGPGGGGGLYRTAPSGIVNLQNTLLAGNAGGDCTRAGGAVNAQHSLIQDALTCINGTNTNNLSGDPALNADLTLRSASRAINAGDNALIPSGVTTDLAGNPRIQQSTVDMGAYESPFATPLCFAEYTGDNSTDFGSPDAQAVRDAVAAASAGGTVKIAGTCAGVAVQGGFTQTVYISKTLTLAGGYTNTNWAASYPITQPTTLDALTQGRVINATAAMTVSNLIVQRGSTTGSGGGALFGGAATLSGTSFISNTAVNAGGGVAASGAVTLDGGLFQNNASTGSTSGGLYAASTLALTGTQFLSNTAAANGGGVFANGAATLNGGMFQNNQSTNDGGGLYADSTLALTGTQFLFNTAAGIGGGAVANGAATLTGGMFQNNQSTNDGGGGLSASSTLALTGTQFLSNTAAGSGGGASVFGAATLTGGVFQNNQSTNGNGGGLSASSTLALTGTQFLSNTAARLGGGAVVNGAVTLTGGMFQNNQSPNGGGLSASSTLALSGTQFLSNTAAGIGGGAVVNGAATLTGGVFQNNQCTGGNGGGLYADDTLALSGTQFLSNTAAGPGGGAVVNGAATLTGGMFQNNRSTGGSGGGLYAFSTLALTGTQFLSNSAVGLGGGAYAGGAATLTGGVFQNNQSSTGGGLYADSTLALSGTQFLSNTASSLGGGAYAGGAYAGGAATLTGGVFQNNQSPTGGGLYADSTLALTGTQFLSNTAQENGGGAVVNGAATLTGAVFQNNQSTSGSGGGLYQAGGSSQVTASCIVSNSDTAVAYIGGTAPITATGNWWGHPSGPSGAGPGIGDSVSSNVDFSGFLGAAILGCPTFGNADVTIAKTVAPPLAAPGQTITFTLAFGNTGARYARSVVISDSIPLSVTITGITSSTVGSGIAITQSSGAPAFVWTVNKLAAGESGVITLTGMLVGDAPPGLVITNTATITAAGDSTAANNSSSATFAVARLDVYPARPGVAPSGSVTISATLTPAQAGVQVNFAVVSGGGSVDNASANTDANGVATVLYTAHGSAAVAQIAGSLASAPELSDRAIVYVAAETTAGGIAWSTGGSFTIGNLSPNFIQVVKTGAGTPPMGWAEFGGNPCPAAAPGSRVVSPYVDVMVDDTAGVETVVVTLKYTDTQFAGQHKLFWCNLGVWQQVTETVSIDTAQQTLVFTVTGATTPALFQLAGTPFVGVSFVPTAATVGDFVAAGQADRVQITWQTLNEIGLSGFHLYRGLDPAGPGERITGAPVPAQGPGELSGFAYSYDDFTPLPAETPVYYWLEELHGDVTFRHGPLRVGGAGSVRVFLPAVQQGSVEQSTGEPAPAAPPAAAPAEETPAPEGLTPGVYLPLIGR